MFGNNAVHVRYILISVIFLAIGGIVIVVDIAGAVATSDVTAIAAATASAFNTAITTAAVIVIYSVDVDKIILAAALTVVAVTH